MKPSLEARVGRIEMLGRLKNMRMTRLGEDSYEAVVFVVSLGNRTRMYRGWGVTSGDALEDALAQADAAAPE